MSLVSIWNESDVLKGMAKSRIMEDEYPEHKETTSVKEGTSKGSRRWTDEEVEILKSLYLTKSDDEIAEILGMTRVQVCGKRSRMGLVKVEHWTEEEDAFLNLIVKRLGRSHKSVIKRLYHLSKD